MNPLRRRALAFLAVFGLAPVISQVVTPLNTGWPADNINAKPTLYPEGDVAHTVCITGTLVLDRRFVHVKDDTELRALLQAEANLAAAEMYEVARAIARGELEVPGLRLATPEDLVYNHRVIGATRGGREITTWENT